MIVYDKGHTYALQCLDGGGVEILSFVKRIGPGYPGNEGAAHPGVIMQEVLRAICDRLDYVNRQIPCLDNRKAKLAVEEAIWYLERRAAKRHNRKFDCEVKGIELLPTCSGCGHIGCPGCERRVL